MSSRLLPKIRQLVHATRRVSNKCPTALKAREEKPNTIKKSRHLLLACDVRKDDPIRQVALAMTIHDCG